MVGRGVGSSAGAGEPDREALVGRCDPGQARLSRGSLASRRRRRGAEQEPMRAQEGAPPCVELRHIAGPGLGAGWLTPPKTRDMC